MSAAAGGVPQPTDQPPVQTSAEPRDFLTNCGEFALAFARAAPHARSFLNSHYSADDLGAWADETRERLIDLLHYVPEPCPLAPEVVAREECGEYTRVDAERIACVGLSVGGYRSAFLVATEPRIKAAIAVGWMCGLGELWPVGRWPNSVGWVHYVPGLYQEMDLPDVAALACPRPLLVMQGSQDRLFPLDGVERALGKLGAIYEKARVPERYASRIYDAPHRFDIEMQEEAFEWLDRWV
jgi:fermentation-respiration switch protein FrsA (DUF1100 family)